MSSKKKIALSLFFSSYPIHHFDDRGHSFLDSDNDVKNLEDLSAHLEYMQKTNYERLSHYTNYAIRCYFKKLKVIFDELKFNILSSSERSSATDMFFTYFKPLNKDSLEFVYTMFSVKRKDNYLFALKHDILKDQENEDVLSSLLTYLDESIENDDADYFSLILKVENQLKSCLLAHVVD